MAGYWVSTREPMSSRTTRTPAPVAPRGTAAGFPVAAGGNRVWERPGTSGSTRCQPAAVRTKARLRQHRRQLAPPGDRAGRGAAVEDPVVKLLAMGRANLARSAWVASGQQCARSLSAGAKFEPTERHALAGLSAVAQAYRDLAKLESRRRVRAVARLRRSPERSRGDHAAALRCRCRRASRRCRRRPDAARGRGDRRMAARCGDPRCTSAHCRCCRIRRRTARACAKPNRSACRLRVPRRHRAEPGARDGGRGGGPRSPARSQRGEIPCVLAQRRSAEFGAACRFFPRPRVVLDLRSTRTGAGWIRDSRRPPAPGGMRVNFAMAEDYARWWPRAVARSISCQGGGVARGRLHRFARVVCRQHPRCRVPARVRRTRRRDLFAGHAAGDGPGAGFCRAKSRPI